jgi:excisionase family DNA binding protein
MDQNNNQPLILLNAREAAAYLRVSLSTLHRMERGGKLQAMRTPGGHRRYTLAMLNLCLESASNSQKDVPAAGDPVVQ